MVIIWLLFGIISAVVGSNKGRSGCGWFILGILLGPLGLILALVVPPDQAELEVRQILDGTKRRCPICAELVKPEAKKCHYCGSDLS